MWSNAALYQLNISPLLFASNKLTKTSQSRQKMTLLEQPVTFCSLNLEACFLHASVELISLADYLNGYISARYDHQQIKNDIDN